MRESKGDLFKHILRKTTACFGHPDRFMSSTEPWVEPTLKALSLEARVGQMMMIGFDGHKAPPHALEWLAAGRAGSVVLFTRNVASPAQLAELTASLRAAAPLPILICVDQEGGVVARMRHPFTESPGNMALGAATGDDATELAARMAGVLAREIRAVGIDWNLAPCLDVLSNPHNPAIGLRSLGADPDRAAELGAALVRGTQAAGVAACAKHFPGHGDTGVDSHHDLPVIASDLARLRALDLKPFVAAINAGVASVMAAHIVFPALDPDRPATLSPAVQTGLLRRELGFEGVITTDCMEMKAVADRYGAGESTVLAALAGADSIVHSHTARRQEEAYTAMLAAARSGRLPAARIEQSVRRLLALKDRYVRRAEAVSLDEVGGGAHRAVSLEAARRALTLVRGALPRQLLQAEGLSPLSATCALIEFSYARPSQAEEAHTPTWLAAELAARLPCVQHLTLPGDAPPDELVARARKLAQDADLLIVATRSAHLNPDQRRLAAELLTAARAASHETLLLCLRNPWDAAAFPEVENVLATLGDARPSLTAAAEALAGEVAPTGRLPVPLA